MKSFTEEGMQLAHDIAKASAVFHVNGETCHLDAWEKATADLRALLQAMEDENKRLRNSYLELRSIFRANMLRAFAGKDVDAEISKALEGTDPGVFDAAQAETRHLQPGEFDLERMKAAIASSSVDVPPGLSRVDRRQLLRDSAAAARKGSEAP